MKEEVKCFPAFGGEALLFLRDVQDLEGEVFREELSKVPRQRREKVEKYKSGGAAKLSLGAGIVLREGLARFGLREDEVKITLGEYEKPYIEGREVYFNLSHSGTKALGIFSAREVGCDIQIMEGKIKGIYERFFHPREIAHLEGLSEDEKREAFFRYWALKEAYIKTLGLGLSLELSSFCVDLSGPSVIEGEKILLEEHNIPGYTLACGIRG